jgi:hypothetical protein
VVAKEDADAFPIIFLSLSSPSYSLIELSDIGDRIIKPRLQTIPGVSGAPIFGERRFSMRVWLSPRELSARRPHRAGRDRRHSVEKRRDPGRAASNRSGANSPFATSAR